MEYANYGNLLDFINIRGPLSEDDARWYFQQVKEFQGAALVTYTEWLVESVFLITVLVECR